MTAEHWAYPIATSNVTAFSARTALPAASVKAGNYMWHATLESGGVGAAVLELVTSVDVVSGQGLVNPMTMCGERG